MNSKLKISIVSVLSCSLVVSILVLTIPRNSQQIEEVTTEATTSTIQDVAEELTLRQQESKEATTLRQKIYCDAPQKRLGEDDGCFTSNGTSVPCRTRYLSIEKMWRKCIPSYATANGENLRLTVCTQFGWFPPYGCYPKCGVSLENNKYPWIVAIYNGDGELLCTGTIITSFYVLTALSCFDVNYNKKSPIKTKGYRIVAGKHYSNIRRKHKSAEVRKIKLAKINRSVDLTLFEVDKEFVFLNDIRPACIDWENFYDDSDFRDGNEAVAVGWMYDKDEVIPCENQNQFNVQYWQHGTCKENLPKDTRFWQTFSSTKFCGSYTGDQTNCGVSKGVGLFFESSPQRYYLKGITSSFITAENVTHIFYTKVSEFYVWLQTQILEGPNFSENFRNTIDRYQPPTRTGCRLPEHIKYGRFRLILGRAYRVNTWVPSSTKITLSCASSEDETPLTVTCSQGTWIPSIGKLDCKRPGSCPALPSSESEDVACRLNGKEVSCTDAEDNTTAIIRCKPFHTISGNKPIYKCHDGEWDQPFTRCTLECGTKRVGVTTLTIGGSETIKNEYPWVAAIYRLTELVCGGTIISKKYVLSAAHCFTDSKGAPRSKELYTIVAGKYYRNISEVEPSAQSRKIRSLHIHEDYKGKLQKYRDDIALIELDMELTPTWEVQPACIDWDNEYEDFDFVDGNNGVVDLTWSTFLQDRTLRSSAVRTVQVGYGLWFGYIEDRYFRSERMGRSEQEHYSEKSSLKKNFPKIVTGWGYTKEAGSPSTVLRKLVIPFRPKDVCVKNLPEDFSEQYVATDKICAGYEDNDMNVCTGDSGGGLYFKSGDSRFYARGIVSLTVKNDVGGCRSNKFALYTKVSKYLSWIESITRRVL